MEALRERGIEPYPAAEYPVTGHTAEIKENFRDGEEPMREVSIAGRIMSRRIMGKASFMELQDSEGRIQVYVSRDDIQLAEDAEKPASEANDPNGYLPAETLSQMYNVVFKKLLDIGDFIGIEGFVFRTQMGEISVHAKKLTVLAKSLRPLPIVKYKDGVAYDGFNDPEQRYRQRYVDLVVNDGVKDTFLKRATILRTMRQVFDEAGYTLDKRRRLAGARRRAEQQTVAADIDCLLLFVSKAHENSSMNGNNGIICMAALGLQKGALSCSFIIAY